jgi:hypothetical protein
MQVGRSTCDRPSCDGGEGGGESGGARGFSLRAIFECIGLRIGRAIRAFGQAGSEGCTNQQRSCLRGHPTANSPLSGPNRRGPVMGCPASV